jgi:NADPH-dependent 2,4-dienoyl-CoA reductase/sulfur reductase-like enzyme/nitrite reductase/ring-hydroxylating ferredoxin subunit
MAEHKLGQADTLLQEGQMKRFDLEDKPVLVARVDGQYFAVSDKCTHYGGPLHEGTLRGNTVMCPWHHACFNIRSGSRVEPPALNDLPHYPLRIENGDILVTLPHDNDTNPLNKADSADQQTIVILGGGAAGNAAAETLRREKFAGKIIMLSAVPDLPVDRPNLSKDYLDGHAKPEWMPLRDDNWYAQRDIELRLNTRVTRVDFAAHMVYMEQGDSLHYDKLLLATGAVPRQLRNTPGADLKGIYTLRTLHDAATIIAAVEHGKRGVVIGSSFIGLEVAASLAGGRKASISVVSPESIPFDHILGDDIGLMFQHEHEANGVQFHLGDSVTSFTGENGTVSKVQLKSGKTLDADFVVVGIGVVPATDFLNGSGLTLDEKDHSVRVDNYLQSSQPDVFAAGDIARWGDGSGTRIEHWRLAEQHGMIAAHNLVGRKDDADSHVPFFWTTQWKITLNYVGHATQWDEIIYRGSPQDKKFIAFYVKEGQLQAAAGCGYDQELTALEFILQAKLPLAVQQMRDSAFSLVDYASK